MANKPRKTPTTPKKQPDPPKSQEELFGEIVKVVGETVGKDQAAKVAAQVIAISAKWEHYSGPIAHPKHLREYEEILPGSADRIISMAERSNAHAQELQNKVLEADIEDTRMGRRYGFWALIILIAAALLVAYLGHTVLAGTFLGVGVTGAVIALINGSKKNSD